MNRFFIISAASLCASTLLATEIILPGLHEVRADLGGTIPATQGAVAAFFLGMAVSPILWGELVARLGARAVLFWGGMLFALASLAAAFSSSIEWLTALRALQGLAAGSATVGVPAAIKSAYPGNEGTRAIGMIGVTEAIAPAFGPTIGLGILALWGWRSMFLFLVVIVVVATVLATRSMPRRDVATKEKEAGYLELLGNRRFLALALVHACSLGAIIVFDVTIPEVLRGGRGDFSMAFQVIQFLGVMFFVFGAVSSGRLEVRFGAMRILLLAGIAHLVLCLAVVLLELASMASYWTLVPWWCGFCLVFGLKAPIGFSVALEAGRSALGRASAVVILLQMAAAGISTHLVANAMGDAADPLPLWACQLGLTVLSLVALALSAKTEGTLRFARTNTSATSAPQSRA